LAQVIVLKVGWEVSNMAVKQILNAPLALLKALASIPSKGVETTKSGVKYISLKKDQLVARAELDEKIRVIKEKLGDTNEEVKKVLLKNGAMIYQLAILSLTKSLDTGLVTKSKVEEIAFEKYKLDKAFADLMQIQQIAQVKSFVELQWSSKLYPLGLSVYENRALPLWNSKLLPLWSWFDEKYQVGPVVHVSYKFMEREYGLAKDRQKMGSVEKENNQMKSKNEKMEAELEELRKKVSPYKGGTPQRIVQQSSHKSQQGHKKVPVQSYANHAKVSQ